MATLADILTAIQNGVQAINNLTSVFPPITAVGSVPPTTGGVTFNSSQVTAFGTVRTSSGGTYTIPLYPSR